MILSFSIRFFLNEQQPDSQGKMPLRLYVNISGRRVTSTMRGIRVRLGDWNRQAQRVKKSDVKYLLHNKTIEITHSEIQEKIQSVFNAKKKITPQDVKQILQGSDFKDDFWKYAEGLLPDLEKKREAATFMNMESFLNRLRKYAPRLTFNEVDALWLRKYESWLYDEGLKNNSVAVNFQRLRMIFNQAIKDGITENYPFKKYTVPKNKRVEKKPLLWDEIFKIESLLEKNIRKQLKVTINFLLLGCFSGLRFSDWKRFEYSKNVQGDVLVIQAKKNRAPIAIPMHDKLRVVVERLKDSKHAYSNTTTNKHLKEIADIADIDKHLTTHIARHTFVATCMRLRWSDESMRKAIGVSKSTIETYKHFDHATLVEDVKKWNQ